MKSNNCCRDAEKQKENKQNWENEKSRCPSCNFNSNVYTFPTIWNHSCAGAIVCLKMSATTITGDCHYNDKNVHLCNIVLYTKPRSINKKKKKRRTTLAFTKAIQCWILNRAMLMAIEKRGERKKRKNFNGIIKINAIKTEKEPKTMKKITERKETRKVFSDIFVCANICIPSARVKSMSPSVHGDIPLYPF